MTESYLSIVPTNPIKWRSIETNYCRLRNEWPTHMVRETRRRILPIAFKYRFTVRIAERSRADSDTGWSIYFDRLISPRLRNLRLSIELLRSHLTAQGHSPHYRATSLIPTPAPLSYTRFGLVKSKWIALRTVLNFERIERKYKISSISGNV